MKTKQSSRFTKLAGVFTALLMTAQTVGLGVPTVHAASTTVQSAVMQVTIDDQFPRVIQYEWLSSGKIMYGQEDALSTVNINGVSYTPAVQFTKTDANKAIYTLTFASINVVMTVEIEVVDNVLSFKVTNIQESGSTLVRTFEIPNQSLISIRDTQAGAQETGVDVRSWNSTKEEYNLLASKAVDAVPVAKSYAILNTNELAASIYSNAFEILTESQRNSPNFNDYEKHAVYQTVAKTGYKKLGLWSPAWTYREVYGSKQDTVELPYVKVAINDDANSDGVVNWQDGGLAYRKIMTVPYGSDIIPKVSSHISHNRMITQWPFLRVLDNLKKFYLYSDGFGQLFEYKGQMDGNNLEPDYGRNFDERSGGQADLNTLATEARKINAYVGIHINHRELNRAADSYSPDKSQGTLDWKGIAPIENMNRYQDSIDNGPTGLAARIAEIRQNVPDLKWAYIDVYSGSGYNQWKLAHELNKNGLMVGTEFSGALDRFAIWNHVNENESKVERFLRNQVNSEFYYDPILLADRHAGSMSYGDDQDEDQGDSNLTVQAQMNVFFTNTLLYKYMQNHEIMKMNIDQTLNQATSVTFDGGLAGQVVTPGTVTNDGTNVTNSPVVELKKNGNLIAKYQKEFKKKIVDTTLTGYHNKKVTPMLTQYLLPWDPQTETKLYHWNSVGGNTTWTLPASWSGVTNVDLYKLTDTGKVLVSNLPVTSGQITINAVADTPYVVYKGSQSDAITPVSALNFGYGGLVKDPGFDSRMLNNWNVTSTSGSTSHATIQTDVGGGTYLQVKGSNGADATIAQTLTGLTPGKTYQASVYAEVKNGRTLTVGVKDYGGAEVTNTLMKSDIPNKEFNTYKSLYGTYLQRIYVNFTVPAGSTSATFYMKANAVAGSSTAEVDLDDIRVVELVNKAPQGSHYLFEDFESNQEGFTPFVYISGNNQIDRLHAGYTYNTLNGSHSVKLTASNNISAEIMRTIPTSLKLLPNTTYTVSFPYKLQYANSYSFALTSGYGSSAVDQFNDKLDIGKYFYSKTFTTGSADDYSLRFIKLPGGTSTDDNQELLVDDFTVDLGAVTFNETADQTFDDGQLGGWIAAYGNGQVQISNQQLSMTTNRYDTIALDQNTPDIADGEMTFTITPQSGNLAGAVIRYTGPNSYTKIYYDPASAGWFYMDPQGHTGTINDPPPGLNNGIHLTSGIPHLVKLTYTGSRYKLSVDQVLLYDGDISQLKTTGGRTGFYVENNSNVLIDNVTMRNLGASSGSTPITPTPTADDFKYEFKPVDATTGKYDIKVFTGAGVPFDMKDAVITVTSENQGVIKVGDSNLLTAVSQGIAKINIRVVIGGRSLEEVTYLFVDQSGKLVATPYLSKIDLTLNKNTIKLNNPIVATINGLLSTGGTADLSRANVEYQFSDSRLSVVEGSNTIIVKGELGTGFNATVAVKVTLDGLTVTSNPISIKAVVDTVPQSQMTATATSQEEGDEASNALDGNPRTLWHTKWDKSDVLPQSITLNLGGTYNINKVAYLPRQSGGNGIITGYNVYVSTDGVSFTKVASGNWNNNIALKYATFASTNASYVKLEATAGVNGFASAAEINVMLTPDTTPPVTTAVVSPTAPDGANGWYIHPLSVTLNSTDNVSGVAKTEFSLDGGATWQSYTAPINFNQDNKYTLIYRSTDKAGNVETPKNISFNLDAIAPTITVTGFVYGTFSDAGDISPIIALNDDLSGVDNSKTTVILDTLGVQQGTTIPLYTLPLGSHTLIVTASDLAGNAVSQTVLFQTTTSVDSIKALVARFVNAGWIDNAGIANSLQSKLTANNLAAFVNEVKAQSGKHIGSEAANYLLRDAQYLLSQK